ncbi:hypothetical protein BD311DRAFT_754601 [Dichomitus squalens]|uniref:Uncharacterized protein n=1 Tax=Dichomitus squalens TaxID=114155 RepID=A0A4Q9MTD5_9APHY|nr:hypothetical protein BD311DRAFT_754601 [Dichomitus squalens]
MSTTGLDSSTAATERPVRVYQAPEPLPSTLASPSVFLAGTITGTDWRADVIRRLEHLLNTNRNPITLLNPLREDWDSSWVERKTDKRFCEQVAWELDAQKLADMIAIYLHPGTPSPISLLELGLSARDKGKVVVCCPDGFPRKGNVEIVCERYKIDLVETLEELIENIAKKIGACRPHT